MNPRHLLRRRVALAAVALPLLAFGAQGALVAAADTPAPSAVGNETVNWISVSPAYAHTGLVLAQTTGAGGCSKTSCPHLWATHNGGNSWARAAARGWGEGRVAILATRDGSETILAGSGEGLERSVDGGNSFNRVGDGGTPAPAPTYVDDATVAVAASSHDYLYKPSGMVPVAGSGGAMKDFSFMYSPAFPNSGSHPAALLSGGDPGTGLPRIQQCNAQLSCTGNTTLAGAVTFSLPVTLLPSTEYAGDGVVFAQSGRGIYKSLDGGVNFALLSVGEPGATATATPMMALAPGYRESGSRTAFVAVLQIFQDAQHPERSHSSGGVYRTDNGGLNWSRLGTSSTLAEGTTAVGLAPDGRLFAGFLSSLHGSGLLCSVDGRSWAPSCPAISKTAATTTTPRGGSTAPGQTVTGSTGGSVALGASPAAGQDTTAAGSGAGAGTAGRQAVGTGAKSPAANAGPWLAGAVLVLVVLAVAGGTYLRRKQKTPGV